MATIYTIIDGDDWIGIYADGSLVYQGHSISAYELLILVSYNVVEVFGKFECCIDWLAEVGQLPENLEDVQMLLENTKMGFYEYLEKSGT